MKPVKIWTNYIFEYIVAFILSLPNLAWIIMDKGPWCGDPGEYGVQALTFYKALPAGKALWPFLHCYKAPFLIWVSPVFVWAGIHIHAVKFALLLIPFTASYITLVLSFKIIEHFFKHKTIAVSGCVLIAGSSLFTSLSTGFWVEPLQLTITVWFIYAYTRAERWGFWFCLAQFIIASAVAMLVKVSSPLYVIIPAIAFWIRVLKSRPALSINIPGAIAVFIALLVAIPAATFYFFNFKYITGFAHFAATSRLYASNQPRLLLWVNIITDNVFKKATCYSAIALILLAIIKSVKQRRYKNLSIVFIALLQTGLFLFAWVNSNNVDSRYFLATLPYYIILICWALSVIDVRLITIAVLTISIVQFIQVNAVSLGAYGQGHWGQITRPLITTPDKDSRLFNSILQLSTPGKTIMLDLEPKFIAPDFQFELAVNNLNTDWEQSFTDVTSCFNYTYMQLDTSNTNTAFVCQKIFTGKPDYYITCSNRSNAAAGKKQAMSIDKSSAETAFLRWAIADSMHQSIQYQLVALDTFTDVLVYKLRTIPKVQ